jgi:energy-coupling factor transport system substrate-specific component
METNRSVARDAIFVATCLALNLGLGKIANLLALPLAFDTVGTMLAAVLLRWPYVFVVAVASSLLGGLLINPVFPFYAGTQIAIALAALLGARYGAFLGPVKALITGFLIGVVSAIVSAPVTAILFKGVAVPSITAINVLMLSSGRSLWESVITGALIVESIDKTIAGFLVFLVLTRLPERLGAKRGTQTAPR